LSGRGIGDTPGVTAAPRPSAAALSGGPGFAVAVLTTLILVLATACGSQSVSPPTTPGPSATTAPSAARSKAPSPSPTADHAGPALTVFVALVTSKSFSYQATFSGQSRHTTDIFQISKGFQEVSGADVLVRATWAFPSHRYVVEHRYVAGKGWIRYDTTDKWRQFGFTAADSMAAFASIRSKADVTYLGVVASGGQTYYQVSFRSAMVHPLMIPAANLTEAIVTRPKLTLLIDAAGRPVKGTATIEGQGRVSGQLQEIVIDLTVAFTKLGQAVTISAP
jgi:hypothetical protein